MRASTAGLLFLLLIVVLVWFALGTQRNIRRGGDRLRWLQDGLPLLGRRTTVRWLGSSAVELQIQDPRPPFREAQVVVVLEPRDVAVLWAWARARRRRDFLILRGRLERAPGLELEAGDVRGWTGMDGLRRLDPGAWTEVDWGRPWLRVAHDPRDEPAVARPLWDRLAEASGGVWRMSIRRSPPHLEVHVLFPDAGSVPAERLLTAFRDLARAVAPGPG